MGKQEIKSDIQYLQMLYIFQDSVDKKKIIVCVDEYLRPTVIAKKIQFMFNFIQCIALT